MHFLIKRNLFDKTVAFVIGYILVLTSMRIMGLDLIKKVMAQGQAQGLKSRLRSRIYLIYCDVEFPANYHFWMRTNFANFLSFYAVVVREILANKLRKKRL